ncbi:choice-of-anchor P family protein [Streptomyces sp. NPDC005065]|uniref:choice-of-anchor P family protein n=1 Tax=unclassified Streptomyces TaxID=2593676 RepID=UPI0033A5417F
MATGRRAFPAWTAAGATRFPQPRGLCLTSTCTATHGFATLTPTIAGAPVTVPTAPNSVSGLPCGARVVINEQSAVLDAGFGTTVNSAHLVVPSLLGGTTADVVIRSATRNDSAPAAVPCRGGTCRAVPRGSWWGQEAFRAVSSTTKLVWRLESSVPVNFSVTV